MLKGGYLRATKGVQKLPVIAMISQLWKCVIKCQGFQRLKVRLKLIKLINSSRDLS